MKIRTPGTALFLLFLVNVLNAVDRNLLSVLNEPIKRDFNLSDGQVGLLATGFALSYALAGFPLGMATDRFSRRNIVAGCLTLWSAMTAVCGVAQTHAQLLVARLGVGTGEAGSGPAILSLIADLYPPERRATMTSIYYLSTSVGFMAALALGGWLAQIWGWRMAFLAAGAPALILLPALFLLVPEPPRAPLPMERASAGVRSFVSFVWGQPSLLWLIVGATVNVLVLSGLGAWVVSYLVRRHGAGLAETGLYIGLLHGVFGLIGTFMGGYLADRLGRSDVRGGLLLVAVASLLASALFIAGVAAPTLLTALAFYAAYALASSIWYGPVYALTQSLVRPRMRGKSSALLYLATNLAGYGVGAPLVGFLSDQFADPDPAYSLGAALTVVALLGIVTALALLAATRAVAADLSRSAAASIRALFPSAQDLGWPVNAS